MTEEKDNGSFPEFKDKEGSSKFTTLGETKEPGVVASVPVLAEFVATMARQHGFGEERVRQITEASQRAIAQIVEHSYKNESGDITLTCKADRWDNLVILISDTGKSYNVLLADAPFDDSNGEEKEKATARFIKRTIDNIEYKILETRNLLTLTAGGRLRG